MVDNEAHIRAKRVLTAAEGSIHALMGFDDSFWEEVLSRIDARTGKIVLTGVGKSGYIAMKVAATLTSLGQAATFVHPVEAMHGDSGMVGDGDVILAFSFSGNTKELLQFVRYVRQNFAVTLIGVTGGVTSSLGTLADFVVPIMIPEEGCPLDLAPMASTTAMLALGDALAAGLTSPAVFTKRDFARFHPSGTLGLSLTLVEDKAALGLDVAVGVDTPLQDALQKMSDVGKGVVAVVGESGELLGSITDGDVRRFFCTNTTCVGASAGSVMNISPKCIGLKETLKDALTSMENFKITNLFVVNEGGVPVGIIHIHDIVES